MSRPQTLHPAHQHPARDPGDDGGWIGVDRGLSVFLVAADADGAEVARVDDAPRALGAGLKHERRLAKSLSRKKKGSHNRRDAAAKLGRHHHRVANVRRHFLHQVSNALVKTHDRLVIENLNISGMLANQSPGPSCLRCCVGRVRPAAEVQAGLALRRASDGGSVVPIEQALPAMRCRPGSLRLADRVFSCGCGHCADRDLNAAVNLARWGQAHQELSLDPRTPKHGGRATNARRRDGADQHPTCAGETSPEDAGTDVQTAPAA